MEPGMICLRYRQVMLIKYTNKPSNDRPDGWSEERTNEIANKWNVYVYTGTVAEENLRHCYTEAHNAAVSMVFLLPSFVSHKLLLGIRLLYVFFSSFWNFASYGFYLNSWAKSIKLSQKWNICFGFEFGFTSAFPVMSL